MTRPSPASSAILTPEELGVGARFSLHPMTTDFVGLILRALESADPGELTVETDAVSTYLSGPEPDLARYLVEVITSVARTGVHTVAHVLLSRGCPGEVTCDLSAGGLPSPAEFPRPDPTGLTAAADWSLYPLLDGEHEDDHMSEIERAIAGARKRGIQVEGVHYATRLRGELAEVVSTAFEGWMAAGATIPHVVTHLNVSLNSPSGERT